MDTADELFLSQFAALNHQPAMDLPLDTVNTCDWNLCALAKVITNRNVMEGIFVKTMLKAWGVDPKTEISMIFKNTFVMHFITENDILHVMHRGMWNYRDDPVAIRRAYGSSDLESPSINNIEMTTLWYRIPTEAVKKKGVLLIRTTGNTTI